jgi:hypothetical protein
MTQQKLKIGDVVETVEEIHHTDANGVRVDIPSGTRFVVTRLLGQGGIEAESPAEVSQKITLMNGMFRPVRSTISE